MSSVVSETQTRQPSQNAWDGGDVGYVWGQCDPKKKGVMSTQGNITKTVPYGGSDTYGRAGVGNY